MFGWWLKDDQRSVASQGYLCVYEVYPLVGYWDAIEKEREKCEFETRRRFKDKSIDEKRLISSGWIKF